MNEEIREQMSPKAECPSPFIAGYLDGELEQSEELSFERHLADCKVCSSALLEQRQILCLLNSSFSESAEIEPPADFAKKVTATAESNVNGLRKPEERLNAYFVIAAMAIFCLFAFFSFADIATPVQKFGDVVAGTATVSFHLFSSLYAGVVVITRSASSQIPNQAVFVLLIVAAVLFLFPAVRRSRSLRG
ncbi:MAG: zf-HC2 domain-containing protein [Acidobacteria bacterium]|nr:zf-HC2 domain-containing protein [Acidobacteriota bacterium]